MSKHVGRCRLCGSYTTLTYEHIPPKKAFNKNYQKFETLNDLLGISGRKYSIFRQGIGLNTLCARCNHSTGGWYGAAFVKWTKQGYRWLEILEKETVFALPFYVMPLNVIKQICVMTLSMSRESALDYHDELRRFVLNKESRYIPSKYKVFVYFNRTGQPRFGSEAVVFKVGENRFDFVEAEITLPPFGYCITSTRSQKNSSLAEHQGLHDITWFSRYDYNDWTQIYLSLPFLQTTHPLPLYYGASHETLA